MILMWFILLPVVGGLGAWLAGRWSKAWARWISLAALGVNLAILVGLLVQHYGQVDVLGQGPWWIEFSRPWIPSLGISFYLALDGLSLLMILLVNFLGIIAVAAS